MGNYVRGEYHGLRPKWRSARAQGKKIGVELELVHPRGYAQLLQLLPDPRRGQAKPVTERDGSLPVGTGLEIVFPPYGYESLRRKDGFFAKAVTALADGGARVSPSCGMHMNVNIDGWSREKAHAFCAVLNWFHPDKLRNIGGRLPNGYCPQRRLAHLADYTSTVTYRVQSVATIRGAYNRVECRFPAASLDHGRVKLLVDFLAFVEDFAGDTRRVAQDDGYILQPQRLTERFLEWLEGKGTKKARKVKKVLMNGY